LRGGLGWVVNHCFLVTRASIASATLATRVGCSKERGEGGVREVARGEGEGG
jgi:hypothetical protein